MIWRVLGKVIRGPSAIKQTDWRNPLETETETARASMMAISILYEEREEEDWWVKTS